MRRLSSDWFHCEPFWYDLERPAHYRRAAQGTAAQVARAVGRVGLFPRRARRVPSRRPHPVSRSRGGRQRIAARRAVECVSASRRRPGGGARRGRSREHDGDGFFPAWHAGEFFAGAFHAPRDGPHQRPIRGGRRRRQRAAGCTTQAAKRLDPQAARADSRQATVCRCPQRATRGAGLGGRTRDYRWGRLAADPGGSRCAQTPSASCASTSRAANATACW